MNKQMRIKSNGATVTITGKAHSSDIELLEWATYNLSFVNGVKYDISFNQWAKNIIAVYDENTPQIKVIVSLLKSL